MAPMVHEVIIRDDLTDQKQAIEVEVILASGERRWCWFATPASLTHFGDTLPDGTTRLHYGVPHCIIMTTLDDQTIAAAFDHIQRHGALMRCTRSMEEDGESDNGAQNAGRRE